MPQPKCSNRSRVGSQVARTAGPESLDVAVLVARGRADVVGRHDAAPAVVDGSAGRGRRRAATARRRSSLTGGRPSCLEDLLERIGVDRREQPVADGGGPDRDLASAPQVYEGRWSDSSGIEQDRRVRADGGSGRPARPGWIAGPDAGTGSAAPAELGRLGQPVERLVRAAQLDDLDPLGQEGQQRFEERWTCRRRSAAAATSSGTRASTSSQSVAASSASSVPARMSSTMERGVGGTCRMAHRPRAGEVSANGDSRVSVLACRLGRPAYGRVQGPSNVRGCRDQDALRPRPSPTIAPRCRLRDPAADARPPLGPRGAVRTGRRSEVVLVRLLPRALDRLLGRQQARHRAVLQAAVASTPRIAAPGLVAYDGEVAVGWVSVGPREDYERLAYSRVLAPIDDTPVWSIVCFVVGRRSRRQGVGERAAGARRSGTPATTARRARGVPGRRRGGPRVRRRPTCSRDAGDVRAGWLLRGRAAPGERDEPRTSDRPPHARSLTIPRPAAVAG